MIAAPNFYADHASDYQEFEQKLKQAKEKATKVYTLWEELEAVKAAYEEYTNS